ncbi:hypothetical protein LTR10_017350 [Elasticomyces elasticus]|uniref:Fe2OG dioxygenase domain-containing protein n=1 Tax=Exophiala sideris TaxID=1016849 RepID=A0ABR0J9N1_9EURO|nr:hypothetical protein LTR10_017350 [Elasticomyces elasticus]KAK5027893.1 hypothetical protein LTS07_006769 [Exophiala sideris]KAK5037517.1 hypothetical protein LTR13_004674 [Exophiala sideris]KAK5059178.1 hypothetical protein LTR69_006467 [Exophiala sideris]KAK5183012.1 hypothetical protein LTR44_004722 [Eurotiomycetes sp. CCFEE 6388]
MEEHSFAPPPPGPPPLLSDEQLLCLAQQGWLCVNLPDSLTQSIQEVFRESPNFFDLPRQQKAEIYPSKQGTEFGYYPVENEKEYITFRCHVHGDAESESNTSMKPALSSSLAAAKTLESKIAQAWHEAGLFLFRILCDITRASDHDISAWNDILDGTLTLPRSESEVTYTLMRLFKYLPTTGFAGEHTDLGLLTLCVGDGEGLQVLDRYRSSRETGPIWVDPPIGTGKGTVIIGETLKLLSSGTVNTGMHRVVGNPKGRSSVVYALRHSNKHDIDFSLFGAEGSMTPLELWKTVQFGKVNINSVKEKRDEMRAKFNAEKLKKESAQKEDLVTTGQG